MKILRNKTNTNQFLRIKYSPIYSKSLTAIANQEITVSDSEYLLIGYLNPDVWSITMVDDITPDTFQEVTDITSPLATHSNRTILDATEEAFTTALKTAYSGAVTDEHTHSNTTALNNVSGVNTGDETLTSIKSKLGAASTSLDGYLTSADWNTFNTVVKTSHVLWVDKYRTDTYTENGSVGKPYKTIMAAVTYIQNTAVAGQDWTVKIMTGQYAENVILEHSNINMIGFEGIGVVGIVPTSGNSIQSTTNNANFVKFRMRNIELTRPFVITGSAGGDTFGDVWFADCHITGAAIITASCIKNLSIVHSYIETDISLNNVAWYYFNSQQMQGAFSLTCDSAAPASSAGYNCSGIIKGVYSTGNVTFTKGGTATGVCVLVGSRINGSTNTITVPTGWTLQGYGSFIRGNVTNAGTLQLRTSFVEKTLTNTGTLTIDQACSQIKNDSSVTGVTVKDALNNVVAKNGIGGTFTTTDGKTITVSNGQIAAIT